MLMCLTVQVCVYSSLMYIHMVLALSGSHKLNVLALWPIHSARVKKRVYFPWITHHSLVILPVNSQV